MEDYQMSDGYRKKSCLPSGEMTGSDTETEETPRRETIQVATVGLSKAREALKATPFFMPESEVQEESTKTGFYLKVKSKSDQTVVDRSIARTGCWATVVSRKKGKKMVQHETVPPKGGALLTVPRSAAVLVTLE
ncbi:unnamed protein product [Pieris macdunnoughi]|uniref:Uncharacterized protein n=1 Tax=Pieris macdunnoughi TaxID=345717 RepID=A0A821XXB9_9NEOP|nr:unnamed protein product [Pieris macdunnoughi]